MKTIKIISSIIILCAGISVSVYAQNSATEGKEFYVNFPSNGYSSPSIQIRYVVSKTCYITARYGDNTYLDNNVQYAPGVYTKDLDLAKCYSSPLPYSGGTTTNNKYIRITSTEDICVYGFNVRSGQSDATSVLPVKSLGTHYTILSNNTTNPNTFGSSISMMAPTTGTTITIKEAAGSTKLSNTPLNTGVVFIYTLVDPNLDITGYTVESNKPIYVFSSVEAGAAHPGGGTEYNWEQMMPTNTAGKQYIVWSMSDSNYSGNPQGTDFIKVVALEDNTIVRKKVGATITSRTLNRHQIDTFNTPSSKTNNPYANNSAGVIELTSDKAFLVEHILGHASCIQTISPVEQRVKRAILSPFIPTGNSIINVHRLHVLIPQGAEDSMKIKEIRGGVETNETLTFYTNTTNPDYKIAYKQYSATDEVLIDIYNPYGFVAYMTGVAATAGESYIITTGSGAYDLNAYFTVDGTPHYLFDGTTLCGTKTCNFKASLSGANTGVSGYIKWYVNGVEQLTARDSLNWSRSFTAGSSYTIRMDVLDLSNATKQTSITFTAALAATFNSHPSTAVPAAKNYNTGNFPTLNVAVSGINLRYQWYRNTTASNTGGTLLTNDTNANYAPTSILPYGDYYYYCIIRDNCGSQTSNVSGVHRITPPISNDTVCAGISLRFTASPINGGSTPAYQWKKNGVIIPGATSQTYIYTPVSGDTITCEMTSTANCASPSMVACSKVIIVHPAAAITLHSNNICLGTTTHLSPSVGGVWTSTNTAVATVTSGNIVTGVGIGSAKFVFTSSLTGCSDTTQALVVSNFPSVNPITSSGNSVCVNSIIPLSDNTTGGVWSLSNNNAQIIGSNTANPVQIEGRTAGDVYVTYTIGTAPCQSSATFFLRILPVSPPTITIGVE